MKTNLTPEYIQKIWDNKRVRQRLAFESPLWFSLLYLRHHFSQTLAEFHMEMFYLIEHPQYELIVIMAFRESGKSTIMNMANVLWSILGKPKKKFALIFSKTQDQAKNHFTNIKHELENNDLLREDFGPFTENPKEWNKLSLELEYHGSKIMSVTREQGIRGVKHNQYRPDLIICDDMEDFSSSVNATESDTLYRHFKSEIVSVGSANTRTIVLGNLISKNSLMMQLKKEIKVGDDRSVFRAYPLLDDNGRNLWKARFPDKQSLKKLSDKSGIMWGKEYLLNENVVKRAYENKRVVRTFYASLRRINKKYGKDKLGESAQVPLIEPMRKFTITAPTLKSNEPTPFGFMIDLGEKDPDANYHREVREAIKSFEDAFNAEISGESSSYYLPFEIYFKIIDGKDSGSNKGAA